MIYDEWVFHDVDYIYTQLVRKLKDSIFNGQLTQGEKIPSVREMAKILHINPNTVMRAYKIVSDDNLIVTNRTGNYTITTDEAYIKQKREEVASELSCSYLHSMLMLGFTKEEAINFIQQYADNLKMQSDYKAV